MKGIVSTTAALVATANAVFQGFNYGSTFSDGSLKTQADYEMEFNAAKNLEGTNGGFTAARLFTMTQGDGGTAPIEAIPAAIKTSTSLLLGLWASAGADYFAGQLAALTAAIETYGDDFASLVAGISVGSEDLYRITETAASNNNTLPGAQPDTLVSYISQVRQAISGTVLEGAKIGHVDTWTVWANTSNQAVFDAVDFVGMDAYPYFEKEHENPVETASSAFQDAIDKSNGGTGGKELWITETGWPTVGATIRDAVAGVENAQKYWQAVGCPRFGKVNIFWYTLQDRKPVVPETSFGIVDENYSPLFDLSCEGIEDDTTTTTSASGSSTTTEEPEEPSSTVTNGGDNNGEDDIPATTTPDTETEIETATPTTTAGGSESGGDGESDSSDLQTTITATETSGSSEPTSTSGSSGSSNDDSGSGSEGSSGDDNGSDETDIVDTNAASGLIGGSSSYAACVLAVMAAILVL